ncbi:hypothetical protein M501DRAFT_213428 [Patellaria atrata CBS 101060]|uniref:Ubiquitin 3 binding protein But2 C-terminal domain-containing protein n=1 Tax=Patellaria atrata CBS 101060 TaxID=1346257 RepID=A0A9P4VQY9_9PEZI|nr:hypothetical protein M501DRAFT_213428 [Patellaria atrata CBS 101060]
MRTAALAVALSLATGAFAKPAPTSCRFKLTGKGGPGGIIGQLSDGQNRIGQGLAASTYSIDKYGGVTDQDGRGCILTPPTSQWQCDQGAAPTPFFNVDCKGQLTYKNNPKFVACPTGDHGGFNIFTTAPAGQGGCVPLTLEADGCHKSCGSDVPAPAPADTCDHTKLTGLWEFPHLIVPVDSSAPDKSYGTSYFGTIGGTFNTIMNFDVKKEYSGKTCSLVFLLPEKKYLTTSDYAMSGPGNIRFAACDAVEEDVTWNSAPSINKDFGVFTFTPGTSKLIATFPCPAGKSIGVEMKGCDNTSLSWFQDYNPAPIGAYITVC